MNWKLRETFKGRHKTGASPFSIYPPFLFLLLLASCVFASSPKYFFVFSLVFLLYFRLNFLPHIGLKCICKFTEGPRTTFSFVFSLWQLLQCIQNSFKVAPLQSLKFGRSFTWCWYQSKHQSLSNIIFSIYENISCILSGYSRVHDPCLLSGDHALSIVSS